MTTETVFCFRENNPLGISIMTPEIVHGKQSYYIEHFNSRPILTSFSGERFHNKEAVVVRMSELSGNWQPISKL